MFSIFLNAMVRIKNRLINNTMVHATYTNILNLSDTTNPELFWKTQWIQCYRVIANLDTRTDGISNSAVCCIQKNITSIAPHSSWFSKQLRAPNVALWFIVLGDPVCGLNFVPYLVDYVQVWLFWYKFLCF